MRNQYKSEMETLTPRREALEQLYTSIEEETGMNRSKRFSGRAAAILVCAVLMVTAAAAAVPTVREALLGQLGVFAPYAQTIEGVSCTDQGLEVRVLSALSDNLNARVYLSVQDREADRLDQCLTLKGRLTTGAELAQPDDEAPSLSVGGVGTSQFRLLSYDADTKTALFSARIYYGDSAQPVPNARLSILGMTTQEGQLYGSVSCSTVTAQTLESLPAEGRVIFRPSDLDNRAEMDALIPSRPVALVPEQTPMPIAGTGDMWISSMGFAGDDFFHIRLGLAEGVEPEERGFFSDLFLLGATDERLYTYQEILVDGGMDILFPLIHPEDLDLVKRCEARFYGPYDRPGMRLEGSWAVDFQMDYHPFQVLDWTGELAGWQVRQLTLSPLSVTMHSNASGGLDNVTLYAVKADGSTVAAQPGTGRYTNLEALRQGAGWDAFNTWEFQEPVDPAEITSLTVLGKTIPVNRQPSFAEKEDTTT